MSLFELYAQVEQNQKLRNETESKFSIMMDRLKANALQDLTLQKLQLIADCLEQNNAPGASQAFRELTTKCWNDVKDFSNAMKTLVSFKQKYQH